MKIQHKLMIQAKCPVDDREDSYEVAIELDGEPDVVVPVEDLESICDRLKGQRLYQEQLTAVLGYEMRRRSPFFVRVTLTGQHGNRTTTITTSDGTDITQFIPAARDSCESVSSK
jgi:hypothetical protein